MARRTGRVPPQVDLPPPKRTRRRTLQVFQILAEEGDGGPEGWFSMPWRRGSSVVGMLCHIHNIAPVTGERTLEEQKAREILQIDWFDASAGYTACEEAIADIRTLAISARRADVLMTALRAKQLDLARSDGGGHTYNALLLARWRFFQVVGLADERRTADAVRLARCFDTVGNDARRAAAFYEAWDAKLYRAAHALG